MGNTSTSQKGNFSADAPRAAKDLDDLLPSLRERFEELAGLPAAGTSFAYTEHQRQHRYDPSGGGGGAAAAAAPARREGEERFLLFDDWMQIPGPRGAEVAKRVYGVLDSDGDGRLDFEVILHHTRLRGAWCPGAIAVRHDRVEPVEAEKNNGSGRGGGGEYRGRANCG